MSTNSSLYSEYNLSNSNLDEDILLLEKQSVKRRLTINNFIRRQGYHKVLNQNLLSTTNLALNTLNQGYFFGGKADSITTQIEQFDFELSTLQIREDRLTNKSVNMAVTKSDVAIFTIGGWKLSPYNVQSIFNRTNLAYQLTELIGVSMPVETSKSTGFEDQGFSYIFGGIPKGLTTNLTVSNHLTQFNHLLLNPRLINSQLGIARASVSYSHTFNGDTFILGGIVDNWQLTSNVQKFNHLTQIFNNVLFTLAQHQDSFATWGNDNFIYLISGRVDNEPWLSSSNNLSKITVSTETIQLLGVQLSDRTHPSGINNDRIGIVAGGNTNNTIEGSSLIAEAFYTLGVSLSANKSQMSSISNY